MKIQSNRKGKLFLNGKSFHVSVGKQRPYFPENRRISPVLTSSGRKSLAETAGVDTETLLGFDNG